VTASPAAAASAADASPEGEEQLWTDLAAGSVAARERLFALHLPFARRLAGRRFRAQAASDIEFADLYQLACTGLLEAIDRFDPARGVPFRGYARRRIGGSMLDGVAQMSEMREQISFRARTRRERVQSLLPAKGAGAGRGEALSALAELAVGLAVGFMLEGTGLFAAESAADSRPTAYDQLHLKRTAQRLRDAMESLPERERAILHHHYEEGLTFEAIGALLRISKGRVSQVHAAALALLRKRLKGAGEFRIER
jgi:RNA polymerase sigma factor for flagellar operon FliA